MMPAITSTARMTRSPPAIHSSRRSMRRRGGHGIPRGRGGGQIGGRVGGVVKEKQLLPSVNFGGENLRGRFPPPAHPPRRETDNPLGAPPRRRPPPIGLNLLPPPLA